MPGARLVARLVALIKPALFVATAFAVLAVPASAQDALRGVALVIGNGDYEHLTPLANPPDDADAIEELLSDLGFDSVRRTDRDAEDLAKDLERFVEDAEDADVAILYYAGHGIEAGGENWLVPVDADISALEAAANSLVPVSDIVRRLRETVPVTIVLLDACRDNPFPDGALLKTAANADPVPLSAGGLTVTDTRGAGSLAKADKPSSSIDNLGIVIGFAAAPGQVALDGTEGENSPYAAALIRHIAAMAGEEFGTVMRMVAEEVYLKTDGRQRPWVNESLRRLLYFGDTPDPVEGPEGDILTERRGLLVTISSLPDFSRQQVERIAGQVGVPMDAVYGMLKVLGADTPDDPVELEKLLRQQTEDLKSFLNSRRVIENPDPELARLSALSDQAVAEGAIETARRLRDEADRRIEELSAVIEREEDLIHARRVEFAAEYAKSAEINRLAFDNAGAAEDFGKAYEQIARWDEHLAWEYRRKQIDNLLTHNRMRGDPQSLERAVGMGEALIGLAATLGNVERGLSRTTLASVRYAAAHAVRDYSGYFDALAEVDAALALLPPGEDRARALGQRGFMLGNIAAFLQEHDRYEEAVSAYRQALTEITRDENAQLWKDIQGELGNQLAQLAIHRLDPAPLREAIDIFDQAKELVEDDDPINRIFFQLQLAIFRIALPKIQNPDGIDAETAAALHAELEANLAELNPEQFPLATGLMEHSIAWALTSKADFEDDPTDTLAEAVSSLRRALQYRTRDKAPGEWAESSELLATTLRSYAFHTQDAQTYREAVAAFEDALSVYSAAGALPRWAPLKAGLVGATRELGVIEDDMATLGRAATIARDTLAEPALAAAPHLRFDISQELVWTLWQLYTRDGDAGHLEEQVAVYDAELPDIDPDERTGDYVAALSIIGDAAGRLAKAAGDIAWFHRSIEANELLLARHNREDRQDFANVSYDTAMSYLRIADREGDVNAIHRALGHLDLAVEYSDPTNQATKYANAVADRATAHHRLYDMEKDTARFDAALAGYREATAIYEREDEPGLMGIHLRNIGLLYLSHDDNTGGIDLHDEAIAALRAAVAADSRSGSYSELLKAAIKLGDALWTVAAANSDWDPLHEAVDAFRTATSVPPDAVSQHELATAHHWHAMALRTLANFDNDTARIEQAVGEFRTAIALRASEAGSGAWYETQTALANALVDLAQRSDGTEHLVAALDSYDAMLRHYADDWTVMGAADLQMKRGNMLRLMGDRGAGAEQYRAAADAYREALRLAEGEDAPDFHVGVRRNLGETLRRLGGATDDMGVLRDAADAFRTALALMPDDGSEEVRALTRRELGLTLSTLGDAGGDRAALKESIEHLTAATGYYSREAKPREWAYLANNIAWLEIVAGRRDGEVERFERAARDLRVVVVVQRGVKDAANLGLSEDSLCAALYELGKARSDSALLAEAAQACQRAIPLLREHARKSTVEATEALLAKVEAARAG